MWQKVWPKVNLLIYRDLRNTNLKTTGQYLSWWLIINSISSCKWRGYTTNVKGKWWILVLPSHSKKKLRDTLYKNNWYQIIIKLNLMLSVDLSRYGRSGLFGVWGWFEMWLPLKCGSFSHQNSILTNHHLFSIPNDHPKLGMCRYIESMYLFFIRL